MYKKGDSGAGNGAVTDPAAFGYHDIDETGFVLDVEKCCSSRGCRSLPVGYHSSDQHLRMSMREKFVRGHNSL